MGRNSDDKKAKSCKLWLVKEMPKKIKKQLIENVQQAINRFYQNKINKKNR
jgi:hypothetical protein